MESKTNLNDKGSTGHKHSKNGIETLSIQEFRENLGSFEDVLDQNQGSRSLSK